MGAGHFRDVLLGDFALSEPVDSFLTRFVDLVLSLVSEVGGHELGDEGVDGGDGGRAVHIRSVLCQNRLLHPVHVLGVQVLE